MKKLGISLVAILVSLPTMARADISPATKANIAANTNVATTSFVGGAHDALVDEINTNRTQINANTTAIAGKQAQLTAGGSDVAATVGTTVRATGTADDTTLVTEKAVRDAITNAGGQSAQQVEDAIDAAAGSGIATDGSGKLSVDLTSNGGLELTGSGDAATIGVKVDGTHVIKDASGNVTLSQTDIDKLTAADSALQASDLDGTTIEQDSTTNKVQVVAGSIGTTQLSSGVVTSLGLADTALQSNSALNGANLTAGTVAESALDSSVQAKLTAADSALQASDLDGTTIEQDGTTNKVQVVAGSIGTTQLSSGVVTSLGLADTALQAADLAGYGFNVYGSWATPSDSTGSVTVTNSNLTANN